MRSFYKKLFDVEIWHDYFLLPEAGQFPADYDISKIIEVTPTIRTTRAMLDHKMVLRSNATGFTVFIAAEFVDSANVYASVVDLSPGLVLSFYWILKDPKFVNYTNQRVVEDGKNIFYFSNRSGFEEGGVTYLNAGVHSFGTTYLGEASYRLGDLITTGGKTFEMIEKESPKVNFPQNASKWQKISDSVIHYVNQRDRLRLQAPVFRHQRPNSNPGEFISYSVFNSEGSPVDLGMIPGTDRPQGEYHASVYPQDPVDHSIDLSHLEAGRYSIAINEVNSVPPQFFYLQDPAEIPGIFAVSDLFVGGAPPAFQFVRPDATLGRWVLDDPETDFVVRFRNRLTRWRYFNQNQTVFHQPATPRPLTKSYSGYQITVPGGTLNLPDPGPDSIVPEVESGTRLIKNIYSHVFLTK